MSFDALPLGAQRIAIIGGGISGLASACLRAPHHAVTLFEAAPRLGGHARRVLAGRRGDQPVDTGFIVFNYANYPHLTRMFQDLDVPVMKSDMSFGASINDGQIEYALRDLRGLLAQPRSLLRPGFARMLRDIVRFNRRAEAMAQQDSATFGELMDDLRLGAWFQNYYLMPLRGAIWSTPPAAIRGFPARALVQFFRNHALLDATLQHQWWTVEGGSIEYVRRLETFLRGRGVAIRTGTPVRKIARDPARPGPQVRVHTAAGERGAVRSGDPGLPCRSGVAALGAAQRAGTGRAVGDPVSGQPHGAAPRFGADAQTARGVEFVSLHGRHHAPRPGDRRDQLDEPGAEHPPERPAVRLAEPVARGARGSDP